MGVPVTKYAIQVTNPDGTVRTGKIAESDAIRNYSQMNEDYGDFDLFRIKEYDKNSDDAFDDDTEYTIIARNADGSIKRGKITGANIKAHRSGLDEDYGANGWMIDNDYTYVVPQYGEDGSLTGFGDPEDPSYNPELNEWYRDNGAEYARLKEEFPEGTDETAFQDWSLDYGGMSPLSSEDPAVKTERARQAQRYRDMAAGEKKAKEYGENQRIAAEDNGAMEDLAEFNEKNGKYLADLEKRNGTSRYEGVMEAVYGKTSEELDEDYERLKNEHARLQKAELDSAGFKAKRENALADLEKPYDNIKAQRDKMHWVPVHGSTESNEGYYAYENGESANQDERNLGTAEYFLNDAKNTLKSDSTWLGGWRYALNDPNTYRRLYGASNEVNLRLILDEAQKLADQGKGWDSLPESARAAIEAWNQNIAAHDLMDPTRGWQFNSAQSTAQSVRFMVDMAISMGITKAAGRVALESMLSKGLLKGVERDALKDAGMTLGKALGKSWASTAVKKTGEQVIEKTGTQFARKELANLGWGVVEGAAQTVLSPGQIFKGFADNLITFDDKGNLPTYRRAFWNATADNAIEIWSENGAEPIWNMITRVPASLSRLAARRFLPGAYRTMSAFFTKAGASGFIRMLRAAGYQGQFEEMFEELAGAAARYVTGVDKDELRDFFTWDNMKTLGISFLPLTALGGVASMAHVAVADSYYKKQRAGVEGMMRSLGYNDSQIAFYLNAIKDDPSQGHNGLLDSMVTLALEEGAVSTDDEGKVNFKGEWAKLLDSVGKYRDAAARKSVFDGAWESEQNRQRREDYAKAQEEYGGDFLNMDEYGSQNGSTQFSAEEMGLAEGAELEGDVQEAAEEMQDTGQTPETRKERRQRRREERKKRREETLNSPTPDQMAQRTIENGKVTVITTTDGRTMFVLGRTESGEWAVRSADPKADDKSVTFIRDDQIRKGQTQDEDGAAREMTAEETVKAGTQSLKDFLDGRILFNRSQQNRSSMRNTRQRIIDTMRSVYRTENGEWQWGGKDESGQRWQSLPKGQTNTKDGLWVRKVDENGEPIKGEEMEFRTWDEIYAMTDKSDGLPSELPNDRNADAIAEEMEEKRAQTEAMKTPLEKLDKDGDGNPVFESADSAATAWDALVEYTGGEEDASETAGIMLENAKKAAVEAANTKVEGNTPAEIKASSQARKAAVEAAVKSRDFWQSVVDEAQRREDERAAENAKAESERQSEQQNEEKESPKEEKEAPKEETAEEKEEAPKEEGKSRREERKEKRKEEKEEKKEQRQKKAEAKAEGTIRALNAATKDRSMSMQDFADTVKKWAEKSKLPIRVISSPGELKELGKEHPDLKVAIDEVIANGSTVHGFEHEGVAYLYAPGLWSAWRAGKKTAGAVVAHEAVAHIGLKNLLDGISAEESARFYDEVYASLADEKERDRWCAYQWNFNMTDRAKRKALGLKSGEEVPAWSEMTEEQKKSVLEGESGAAIRRGAADEYMADLAESLYGNETIDERKKSLWKRIVEWVEEMLGVGTLRDEDLADALYRYQKERMRERSGQAESGTLGQAETAQERETENEASKGKSKPLSEARIGFATTSTYGGYDRNKETINGSGDLNGFASDTRSFFKRMNTKGGEAYYCLLRGDNGYILNIYVPIKGGRGGDNFSTFIHIPFDENVSADELKAFVESVTEKMLNGTYGDDLTRQVRDEGTIRESSEKGEERKKYEGEELHERVDELRRTAKTADRSGLDGLIGEITGEMPSGRTETAENTQQQPQTESRQTEQTPQEQTQTEEKEAPNEETAEVPEVAERGRVHIKGGLNSRIAEKMKKKLTPEQVKKLHLENFGLKDEMRPSMKGIYYKDGYAYASDSHILIKVRMDYPAEWEGKIIDPKTGRQIEAKFPDAEGVLTTYNSKEDMVRVSPQEVLDALKAAEEVRKGATKKNYKISPDDVLVAVDSVNGALMGDDYKTLIIKSRYAKQLSDVIKNCDNVEVYAEGPAIRIVADGVETVLMRVHNKFDDYIATNQAVIYNGKTYLGKWLADKMRMEAERLRIEAENLFGEPKEKALKEADRIEGILANAGDIKEFEAEDYLGKVENGETKFNAEERDGETSFMAEERNEERTEENDDTRFSAEERAERQFEETRFMVAADLKNDPLMLNGYKKFKNEGMAKRLADAKNMEELNSVLNGMCDDLMEEYFKRKIEYSPKDAKRELMTLQRTDNNTAKALLRDQGIRYKEDGDYTDDEMKVLADPVSEKLAEYKKRVGEEWDEALEEYPPIAKYVAMKGIQSFMNKPSTKGSPVPFIKEAFDLTMSRFEQSGQPVNFNFYNEYNRAILDVVNEDENDRIEVHPENGVGGTWVKVHKASESEDAEKSKAKAAAASLGSNWCTRFPDQGCQKVIVNDNHDMYFFYPEGSTQAQIAVVPIRPGEEGQLRNNQWYTGVFKRDNGTDNSVPSAYFGAVNELAEKTKDTDLAHTLDAVGYGGMTEEERKALLRQNADSMRDFIDGHGNFTADDIDEIYRLFNIQLIQNGDRLAMHEFNRGIYEGVVNAMTEAGMREEEATEYADNFWTMMFDSINEIEGSLDLDETRITDLGNVESVGGNLYIDIGQGYSEWSLRDLKRVDGSVYISNSDPYYRPVVDDEVNLLDSLEYVGGDLTINDIDIESLGAVKYVGGSLDLDGCAEITSFGGIEHIGGGISLKFTGITSLEGIGKEINGDLELSNSKVTSLGEVENVYGNLYASNLPLADLGKLKWVGKNAEFAYSKISSLGSLMGTGSDLNLNDTKVESLGELKSVGNDLEIKNTPITTLGGLRTIGGWLDTKDTALQSLGDLERVFNLYIRKDSKIQTLGNLKEARAAVIYNHSLTSLGSLEHVERGLQFGADSSIPIEEQRKCLPMLGEKGELWLSNGEKLNAKGELLNEGETRFSAEERNEEGTRKSAEEKTDEHENKVESSNTSGRRKWRRTRQYFTGTIRDLVAKAKLHPIGEERKIISGISDRLKEDAKREGVEIDTDYKHVLTDSEIRHTINHHGGENEVLRGQIPITDEDFDKIPDIINNYDNVYRVKDDETRKRKYELPTLRYEKAYDDGTIIYLEEVRTGKKELAFKTLYKKRNPKRLGANRTNATPIPNSAGFLSSHKGSENSGTSNESAENSRFSAEEREINETVDAARDRLGVELTPTDMAGEADAASLMALAVKRATDGGRIPNMSRSDENAFYMDAYRNAGGDMQRELFAASQQNGFDVAGAVRDRLADLAMKDILGNGELTSAERGWLYSQELALAERLGVDSDTAGYVLWNRANGGNDLATRGMRSLMQQDSGLDTEGSEELAEKAADVRFSASKQKEGESAATAYDMRMRSVGRMFSEQLENEFSAIDEMVKAIETMTGKKVARKDDPSLAFNQLTSKTQAGIKSYMAGYLAPMWDEIAKVTKNTDLSFEDVMKYLHLKHGLERNEAFHQRAVKQAEEARQNGQNVPDPERRDYSGLTARYKEHGGDIAAITAAAEAELEQLEQRLGAENADALWDKIRAATERTLDIQVETGLISAEQRDRLRDEFDYYIPLQGFDEEVNPTNEDKYAYQSEWDARETGDINKAAKGRVTMPANPIVAIAAQAQRSIVAGERNMAKKTIYDFVQDRQDNDLASLGEVWYVRTVDDEGNEVYKQVVPDLSKYKTPEERAAAVKEWEEKMRANPDAVRESQRLSLPGVAFTFPKDAPQHVIEVRIGGELKRIYINGDPRVAQVVNGQISSVADNAWYKGIARITRGLSGFYTTFNPEFFLTNFLRDMQFAAANIFVKENGAYQRTFARNLARAFRTYTLSGKYKKGTLDLDDKVQKMYEEFASNGGITGYSQMRSNEDFERMLTDYINGKKGFSLSPSRMLNALMDGMESFTSNGENIARFAAYMTSRDMGRGIRESVADAKDVTVNFNRRGSTHVITADEAKKLCPNSRLAQGAVRAMSGVLSTKVGYAFFNVSVQGIKTWVNNTKKHPAKAAAVYGAYMLSGLLPGFIHGALSAMAGGDAPDPEEWYWNIPEHTRRNNIIIGIGNGRYIKIPLPQEIAPFHALGDIIATKMAHKDAGDNNVWKALESFADMLPLNPVSDGGFWQSVMPTGIAPVTDVLLNKDYRGMSIHPDYGKDSVKPKWQQAYDNTADWAVTLSRLVSKATGGDDFVKGRVEISPEDIEHVVTGYLGGVFSFANRIEKTVESMWDEDERVETRSIPFVNRVIGDSGDFETGSYLTKAKNYAKGESEEVKAYDKGYKENRMKEERRELRTSPEYRLSRTYKRVDKQLSNIDKRISRLERQKANADSREEKLGIDEKIKELKARKNRLKAMLARSVEDSLYGE